MLVIEKKSVGVIADRFGVHRSTNLIVKDMAIIGTTPIR